MATSKAASWTMSKIPCVVITYYDFESIKETIECLLNQEEALDLFVIENRSEFTDELIKP